MGVFEQIQTVYIDQELDSLPKVVDHWAQIKGGSWSTKPVFRPVYPKTILPLPFWTPSIQVIVTSTAKEGRVLWFFSLKR